jgi:hypothetical protein
VSPTEQDLPILSNGAVSLKIDRVNRCEDIVKANCPNTVCLRLEAFRQEKACDEIMAVIENWANQS